MRRSAFVRGLLAGAALVLLAPAAALADASLSTNWAGYAVHRPGVRFRNVTATWKQPAAHCTAPNVTYEASWVGIGGYSSSSNALEQVGTELDCSAAGAVHSGAWYEVVPAPSKRIAMTIRPGDTVTASVTVVGHRVTLTIVDRTRRASFTKRLTVAAVDIRSAEWIVEAPSGCFSDNSCRTLPLTDFGTESFTAAGATTARGRRGSITSSMWGRSKITLAPVGRGLISSGSGARAVPSALTHSGSSFMVTYGRPTVIGAHAARGPRAASAGAGGAGGAIDPGGRRR